MIGWLKKIFAAICFLSTTIAFCQSNRFDVGITGSESAIFLWGNEILKKFHTPAMGFSTGIFFQYNINNVISLRPELAYERKGSVIKVELTDAKGNLTGNGTINFNFNYLVLPVLVRASSGKDVPFFINAGPYIGYLLDQYTITKGDNIPTTTSTITSIKKLDMGFSAGVGLSVPIKRKLVISLEIRNNLGLLNVSQLPVINNGTIRTNSTNILLSLAYKLGFNEAVNE
jgi:hypothetical protein